MSRAPEDSVIEPGHFRKVLGHFPTGVCVITAIGLDGQPVGMAVGSFTSVSLDPALVAFLPDRSSTTFPKIREAASFCVNVLAAEQEEICRTFASRGADKFAETPWHPAPSGAPIIDGVVAWIDCTPETIYEAGDHYIFIGRVQSLEVDNPTLPLVFFQGGYGAFTLRSVVLGAQPGLRDAILLADRARPELERLASSTGVEVQVFAPVQDAFVLVASAAPSDLRLPSRLGIRIPIAPPAGRLFVAWAGREAIEAWYDRSPTPLDARQRAELDAELEIVRRNGWLHASYSEALEEVWTTIMQIGEVGHTPTLTKHLAEATSHLDRHYDPSEITDETAGEVHSLLAPVFDGNGNVFMMITLVGIERGSTLARIMGLKDDLLATAAAVTETLGPQSPHRG